MRIVQLALSGSNPFCLMKVVKESWWHERYLTSSVPALHPSRASAAALALERWRAGSEGVKIK